MHADAGQRCAVFGFLFQCVLRHLALWVLAAMQFVLQKGGEVKCTQMLVKGTLDAVHGVIGSLFVKAGRLFLYSVVGVKCTQMLVKGLSHLCAVAGWACEGCVWRMKVSRRQRSSNCGMHTT